MRAFLAEAPLAAEDDGLGAIGGVELAEDVGDVVADGLRAEDQAAGDGLDARFRRVYVVDLTQVDASGAVVKSLAVDLAAIPDPDLVSLPAIHPGDVGLGDPFRVTCESVEGVQTISGTDLLITCDNNLPNTGRNPGLADDTEMIVVKVPDLREPA